ncbi:hypothetical protein BGZ82_010991 [Podila clonocystis]|nr:hypothetical protein BGZ82_010991 [Podila clonocystis]
MVPHVRYQFTVTGAFAMLQEASIKETARSTRRFVKKLKTGPEEYQEVSTPDGGDDAKVLEDGSEDSPGD